MLNTLILWQKEDAALVVGPGKIVRRPQHHSLVLRGIEAGARGLAK